MFFCNIFPDNGISFNESASRKMQYLKNGETISERAAWLAFESAGMNQGHESNELLYIWLARFEAEESRELISELSNYELELIPVWQ